MSARLLSFVLVVLASVLVACSTALPKPPTGPRVREQGVEVPYPPPAARVEVIPPQKQANAVWVPGQWDWDGEVWVWIDGRWRVPPESTYFTAWSAQRHRDGRLMFQSAAWRTRDGRRIADPFGEATCPPLGEEAP